jgi:hypothetical protein
VNRPRAPVETLPSMCKPGNQSQIIRAHPPPKEQEEVGRQYVNAPLTQPIRGSASIAMLQEQPFFPRPAMTTETWQECTVWRQTLDQNQKSREDLARVNEE